MSEKTKAAIPKEVGAVTTIPVSPTSKGPDYLLCRALREVYPDAKTPSNVQKLQANYARVYGAWTTSKPVTATQRDTKWKPTEVNKPSLAFAAPSAIQTLTWAVLSASVKGLESPLSPQPKSQCNASMRPDTDRWLKAEETEMATCYEKGTFEIVDLPGRSGTFLYCWQLALLCLVFFTRQQQQALFS
eukprot:917402-Rhodomonas_salina.2